MEKRKLQLNKAYKKSFKLLNKNFLKSKTFGLDVFVEHLKYIRDIMILQQEGDIEAINTSNITLATIITAIAEYEASTHNHEQKCFHWNNFCELVKQNMEEWLALNDSV
jgi:hypothetical protein